MMKRTLVVAMMLASASSFAPSPKTQLATRRPAQAPPRLKYIEDLKLRADKATTALGLFRSTALLTSVYALQYNNEGLRVAYAVVFVAAVTGAIKAESLANKATREIQEVCPYHCAPLWSPIASLELLASLELAPGVPRLPGAPSPP